MMNACVAPRRTRSAIMVDFAPMKSCLAVLLVAGSAGSLVVMAQSPDSPAGRQSHSSELGFSYTLPRDWDVVDSQGKLPALREQAGSAAGDEEKKGLACIQVALTARHGDPASVVVVVALPFDCFGESMTEAELPGFASGASEGLKQSFDVGEPVSANYALGSHKMWIERAKATPTGHPESTYTVEITCGLLKKAAVCWMAIAADDSALRTFEHGSAILDGQSAGPLVPAAAFDKKP